MAVTILTDKLLTEFPVYKILPKFCQ